MSDVEVDETVKVELRATFEYDGSNFDGLTTSGAEAMAIDAVLDNPELLTSVIWLNPLGPIDGEVTDVDWSTPGMVSVTVSKDGTTYKETYSHDITEIVDE